MELKDKEEKINIDDRKKMSLSNKLKTQFANKKISQMDTPDKLEDYVVEKFKREKSELTKEMANLYDEISINIKINFITGGEGYTDKENLKRNIIQDFEKQESWQSYYTLLFSDINPYVAKESKDSGGSSKKN